MFLRQLEYLVALSQERHFSRAARHCNISQPSLSNAIKQLEMEFGTPIVLRHQRFQGFTAEGSRVVEWSKRILADRDAMLQELSVLKKTLSGRIRLGAMPTSSPVLPQINGLFLKRHPGVQVDVSFLGLDELRVKLTNFELDVGITYIDQKQPPPLSSCRLYDEHLSLLVPDDARFPAATTTWSEAARLPLCLLAPHMHERQIIDAAFASVGETPMPLIESDSIVNLAFHTMAGGVVTVVPSHFELVIGGFPGTRVVKLVKPEVVREVGLIWVDGDPMLPMAKAMLDAVKAMAITELVRVPAAAPKIPIGAPARQLRQNGRRPASR
ncbi:MAG: LysR family transcriptional regulator [Alphaproteobacteria bacterium]|jgi:DNA-binding transcriptional LysR family regulator|nr:MAG: LysR family transcriptional regulator [Alphaproteobacteria bacterium]